MGSWLEPILGCPVCHTWTDLKQGRYGLVSIPLPHELPKDIDVQLCSGIDAEVAAQQWLSTYTQKVSDRLNTTSSATINLSLRSAAGVAHIGTVRSVGRSILVVLFTLTAVVTNFD